MIPASMGRRIEGGERAFLVTDSSLASRRSSSVLSRWTETALGNAGREAGQYIHNEPAILPRMSRDFLKYPYSA
jgi:hypothetical protein